MNISDYTETPLYKDTDIVPMTVLCSECRDEADNYLIVPAPNDLAKSNSDIKIIDDILDSRFINCYNPETNKYSLPFLSSMPRYMKLEGQYVRNLLLASVVLADKSKKWQIDGTFDKSQLFIQIVD